MPRSNKDYRAMLRELRGYDVEEAAQAASERWDDRRLEAAVAAHHIAQNRLNEAVSRARSSSPPPSTVKRNLRHSGSEVVRRGIGALRSRSSP